ncbi:MAG: Gfo/Idh/MocA family oxidoreductase [Chitinophagaceae bacterium]|nr:MAG: Gfo/Idh/MocA family oxidoreductase [Chitinophagaceae bacterium]
MKYFAIVGCGRIAKRHAKNIARVGKLLAVCDPVKEKADEFAKGYGCRSYASLDELLAAEQEVEIVAVCSPNGMHAEHIIKSLQAEKDVLTEKPLCLTKAAAWQIIETEKFCRRRLFVVKSARYNPIVKQLKQSIEEGSLGKLYSFHLNCIWNRTDEYYTGWKGKLFPDGGTLYNQFSHYVDVMLWLFGNVVDVKGFRKNLAHEAIIEFEDTGAVALQMQNDILGSLHWSVNAFRKNVEISLTILAEKGSLKIGGENLNQVQYCLTETEITFPVYERENWSHHGEIYDHLMRALNQPGESFPDAFDGLRAVETIEKIYKATA